MKQLIGSILIILILTLLLNNEIGKSFIKIRNQYEKMIGKRVIYKKDTLQIIDYSFINSTVTLDDSTIMKYSFVIKLDTIK